MDQNDVEHVCPFCTTTFNGPVPPSCKMCGNSFRDLNLNKVVDGEGLIQGLEKVTEFTRKQQEEIKNRKNWYKEELQKKHPKSNVKWDGLFQTNYQRVHNMTTDDSLNEIEHFVKMADGKPHDEEEWNAFLNKYKGFDNKLAKNLPVSDTFLSKLQHDRSKKDKDNVADHERALRSNNVEISHARYGAKGVSGPVTQTETSSQDDVVRIPVVSPNQRIKINASEREAFNFNAKNNSNQGKGEAAFSKYLRDQEHKSKNKKLW